MNGSGFWLRMIEDSCSDSSVLILPNYVSQPSTRLPTLTTAAILMDVAHITAHGCIGKIVINGIA